MNGHGSHMVRIAAAGGTEVGRVRSRNEDAYLVGGRVFAVADGLGGHAAGDLASATALEPLSQLDAGEPGADLGAALTTAVQAAHRLVRAVAAQDPGARHGMGTTLTAVGVEGDDLLLAHVGDSRCYLLRDGELMRRSRDHTPVQEEIDAGRLRPEDAGRHPARHILAQAVGLDDGIRVDTRGGTTLRPGDTVLLCSDGLTEMVTDEAIADLLRRCDDPQTCVDSLVDAALRAGGVDNITVVVLRVS